MKQKIAEILGETGCYFFSIIHIAEKITGKIYDPIQVYIGMVNSKNPKTGKYIIEKDCFINEPGLLLSALTGMKWGVTKADARSPTQVGDHEVLYFENPTTLKTYGHFVVGNGLGSVEYDPYGDSNTVRNGTLHSKRVFYKL
jgi:hypothetical protein